MIHIIVGNFQTCTWHLNNIYESYSKTTWKKGTFNLRFNLGIHVLYLYLCTLYIHHNTLLTHLFLSFSHCKKILLSTGTSPCIHLENYYHCIILPYLPISHFVSGWFQFHNLAIQSEIIVGTYCRFCLQC